MHIVTIAQQKGGTGKTSTASALASGLARQGLKCLLLDLDAQGNLTFIHKAKTDHFTTLELLTDPTVTVGKAAQAIGENLDMIPATEYLALAAERMTGNKPFALQKKLKQVTGYDACIIDTPPELGLLTLNALMASASVILPCLADVFSIAATAAIGRTLDIARTNGNAGLKVDGILLTRYNGRQCITRDITRLLEQAAERMHTKVFEARIRDAVAVKEAQAMQQDLFSYAPKSTAAQDYSAFIAEVLAGWNMQIHTNR